MTILNVPKSVNYVTSGFKMKPEIWYKYFYPETKNTYFDDIPFTIEELLIMLKHEGRSKK